MTHTPGPWRADRQYVIDADALTVARVASHGARAQYEANARLIAAAPAMLEALKLAYRALGQNEEWQEEPREQIRAVIERIES